MNTVKLAAALNGFNYPLRLDAELIKQAKENDLVIVYGASDDLMEFRGAIYDEVGAYEGGHAFVHANEILQPDDLEQLDEGDIETVLHHFPKAKVIEAIWSVKGVTWSFKTDIPHSNFEVMEDGEVFCRGIVFSLNELEPKEEKLKSLKNEAFSALDDAVSKLHVYASECECGEERETAFAIYEAARRSRAAR